MTTRTYPYTAWTLMPSFKPVEVTLVGLWADWTETDYGDKSGKGKRYATTDLFASKQQAIEEGWRRVNERQAWLDEQAAKLDVRRIALTKAAKEQK